MGDRKPPQTVGDERATVLDLLQFQRESFLRKVEGLSEEDARRTLVGSGTTLLWLTKHVAFAETIWVLHRFAQLPDVVLDNEVHDTDTVTDAIAGYREVWAGVDSVVAATPDLSTMCADTQFSVDLRWILLHLLEEIARHAGHADILRELIDGSTGR